MQIIVTDWFSFLAVLVVLALILLGLIYVGVRMALIDQPNLPRFSCATETEGRGTRFTVFNFGTSPGFDVAVRWAAESHAEPMARTRMIAPHASWEWEIATPGSPEPRADADVVDWLLIEWCIQPGSGKRQTRVAVRVPASIASTLAATATAARAVSVESGG